MFTGDERQDSYEVGKAWFTRARAAASRRLVTALRTLVGRDGSRWFLLLGMVHEAGGDHDVARLASRIGSSRPGDVLIALVGGRTPALQTAEGRSLVRSMLAGDSKAALAVAERAHGSPTVTRRLIQQGAAEVRRLTLEVIERFTREVFTSMGDNAAALEADIGARARSARRMSASHLIDVATGGISYEGEAGIDQVLLVPSVVTRPWITISDWDSTKIICYRASQGGRTAGGEPDQDLVLVYRALGDETRLRLLRELAAGDRRLAELSKALGLAKSTLHGHLGVLRSAGMVRVRIGAEKKYGLRPGLPDLNRILAEYIGGG